MRATSEGTHRDAGPIGLLPLQSGAKGLISGRGAARPGTARGAAARRRAASAPRRGVASATQFARMHERGCVQGAAEVRALGRIEGPRSMPWIGPLGQGAPMRLLLCLRLRPPPRGEKVGGGDRHRVVSLGPWFPGRSQAPLSRCMVGACGTHMALDQE
eukprot:365826-Chlamydomonas_euryale.AAC.8